MEAQLACPKNKKRTKAGVLVSEITLEDLQSAFHLPTERACVKLGVGLTILKRLCRKHGIARWPYRSLLKAGKAQRVPNTPSATSSPLSSPRVPAPCPTPSRDGPKAFMQPSVSSSSTSQYGAPSEASELTRRRSCSEPQQRPQLPASRSCAALAAAFEAMQATTPTGPAADPPTPVPAVEAAVQTSPVAAAVQHPQAHMAKSTSQLGLLLSAIDAYEGQEEPEAAPIASPLPALGAGQPWAPFALLAAADVGRPGPLRRTFKHSACSAFRPTAPAAVAAARAAPAAAPAPLATAAPVGAALEAKRAELQQRLAMLQQVQAQVRALAPSPPPPDTAAGLLRGLGVDGLEEQKRLQLAEKLLMVRAALQARIARKRAALAAAGSGRFSPVPTPPSGPLFGLPSGDFAALASAQKLLGQYRL
ncbi:hypothetical protein ABPG77_008857 [Micractinium sp. CCAP 211/92]